MRKIAINLETQKRNASRSLPVILYRQFVTYLVTVKINAFIIIIIKYHIFSYFIIYIYTVKQSNMLDNIFAILILPMNNFTGN